MIADLFRLICPDDPDAGRPGSRPWDRRDLREISVGVATLPSSDIAHRIERNRFPEAVAAIRCFTKHFAGGSRLDQCGAGFGDVDA